MTCLMGWWVWVLRPVYTQIHMYKSTHTRTHARTHACTHARTHTHTHTHTHTQALFLEKLEYFRFLATDQTEAAILAVCRSGNRRLRHARLRFVSQQEHLYPHCFGTFSISSFQFHFVLSENHLKIISTQHSEKMTNACICSGNTSLDLNYHRIQCPGYTMHNTETNIMTARGRETYNYTCATENPELSIFLTAKQTNHKTCPKIFMVVFFSLFFSYAGNLSV